MVLLARRGVAISALLFVTAAPACSSVPTFPAPARDGGVQCTDASPCPSGQTCLQGVCYAACDMTHPCGAHEMCASGVCVARTSDAGMPARDVGVDGGPCVTLACSAPTAICRADVAACVACTASDSSSCGGGTPICNVGRGECTAFAAGYCEPCNNDADCRDSGGTSYGHCVTRTSPTERVCLPVADASGNCPPGFLSPVPAGTDCQPANVSCTAFVSAVTHRSCAMDSDCVQLGGTITDGIIDGMCTGTCHWACAVAADCPSGLTCDGTFCQ